MPPKFTPKAKTPQSRKGTPANNKTPKSLKRKAEADEDDLSEDDLEMLVGSKKGIAKTPQSNKKTPQAAKKTPQQSQKTPTSTVAKKTPQALSSKKTPQPPQGKKTPQPQSNKKTPQPASNKKTQKTPVSKAVTEEDDDDEDEDDDDEDEDFEDDSDEDDEDDEDEDSEDDLSDIPDEELDKLMKKYKLQAGKAVNGKDEEDDDEDDDEDEEEDDDEDEEEEENEPPAKKTKTQQSENKTQTPAKADKTQTKVSQNKQQKITTENKTKTPAQTEAPSPGVLKAVQSENEKARKERDSRTLFIKNIPFDAKEDNLKSLSDDILEVRLAKTFKGNKEKLRGFGFLEFGDEKTCEKNFKKLQGKKFGGRNVVVDYLGEKSLIKPGGTDTFKKQQAAEIDPLKLYITGLSQDTTAETLKSNFPKAVRIDVPKRRNDNKSMGFAFVLFKSPDDAKVAHAKMQNKKINGRSAVVLFSRKKPETAQKRKAETKKERPTKKAKKETVKKNDDKEDEDDEEDDDEEDDEVDDSEEEDDEEEDDDEDDDESDE